MQKFAGFLGHAELLAALVGDVGHVHEVRHQVGLVAFADEDVDIVVGEFRVTGEHHAQAFGRALDADIGAMDCERQAVRGGRGGFAGAAAGHLAGQGVCDAGPPAMNGRN